MRATARGNITDSKLLVPGLWKPGYHESLQQGRGHLRDFSHLTACAQKVPEPSETMRDYRELSSGSHSPISFDGRALCSVVSLSPPGCSHIECVARLELDPALTRGGAGTTLKG